jgi:hypothetical protein
LPSLAVVAVDVQQGAEICGRAIEEFFLHKKLTICIAAALWTACVPDNPCPEGLMQSGTRCVSEFALDGGARQEPNVPNEKDDADTDDGTAGPGRVMLDPEQDASAQLDAEAVEDAANLTDSEATALDADVGPSECGEPSLTLWRSFLRSERLIPEVLACYAADPNCNQQACSMAGCLTNSAQVSGCDRCIAAEVECALRNCSVPCSIGTKDDACRACACTSGCFAAPHGCGQSAVDVCADCTGASCRTPASATEAITIPVAFHFHYDHTDPATGLPAYTDSAGRSETILDIDASLAAVNGVLDGARTDARRLQLMRVAVNYTAPAAGSACPDAVVAADPRRMYGALNIALTGLSASCPAIAANAYAARAEGGSLLQVIGNLFGVSASEQGAGPWLPTAEQFVRMHNYVRWRLASADAVPEAEKQASSGLLHGPKDPIWERPTNRDWALVNASVFATVMNGPFSALPVIENFVVPKERWSRRVLGVRISARISGTPSEGLLVELTSPRKNYIAPVPRSHIRIDDGTLTVEDAFDATSDMALLPAMRNVFGGGTWKVRIEDAAPITVSDLRFELLLGDRVFTNYDRHARGAEDIFVYRRATSELLTAMNPANGSLAFAAPVADRVPPLPDQQAQLVAGDVDGDGWVDLLARRGASTWIAFYRHGFRAWAAGAIAGGDLPTYADEVLMADFDLDGFGDLLRRRPDVANDVSLWAFHRGVGDGTFEAGRRPTLEGHRANLNWTVSNLSFAGRSELFIRDNAFSLMNVVYNNTVRATTSGPAPLFWGGWSPRIGESYTAFAVVDRFLVMDANYDGSGDLVVANPGYREWSACLNEGRQSFAAPRLLSIGSRGIAFREGDVLLGSAPQ